MLSAPSKQFITPFVIQKSLPQEYLRKNENLVKSVPPVSLRRSPQKYHFKKKPAVPVQRRSVKQESDLNIDYSLYKIEPVKKLSTSKFSKASRDWQSSAEKLRRSYPGPGSYQKCGSCTHLPSTKKRAIRLSRSSSSGSSTKSMKNAHKRTNHYLSVGHMINQSYNQSR